MTVAELIETLKQFPEDLEVVARGDEGDLYYPTPPQLSYDDGKEVVLIA